jgi:hypothetical protein
MNLLIEFIKFIILISPLNILFENHISFSSMNRLIVFSLNRLIL